MSHFFLIHDPDPAARSQSIDLAKRDLSELGLEICSASFEALSVVWTRSRAWGGSVAETPESLCLLMGQALVGGKKPAGPADLESAWSVPHGAVPEPFDGIHMAAMFKRGVLALAADVLGRFPVYYLSEGERFVAASSPELFRCIPNWRWELNKQALADLLMLNYFQGHDCLYKGVCRLGAGNFLQWNGSEVVESKQYRMPYSDEYFGLPFEAQADLLDEVFSEAIEDHVRAGGECEMFCSGGLDSRMLAGYVAENPAVRRFITWGDPDENEMICATRVVRKLRVEHERWPVQFENFPAYARMAVKWQGLSIGMNAISFWQGRSTAPAPGGILSGHAMDVAMGGSIVMTYNSNPGVNEMLARDGSWGVPPQALNRLLRPEVFNGEWEASRERMRDLFCRLAETDFQRIHSHALLHRQRFHSSAVLGLHGLWGWPILPSMDRRVLRVLAGFPKASFLRRKLQKHILQTRFPELAKLPLDLNSPNPEPLIKTAGYRVGRFLRKAGQRLGACPKAEREKRFYYQIMDYNGPAWTQVRREAEPGRKKLEALLDADELARLAPPPEIPLRTEDCEVYPNEPNPGGLKKTSAAMLLNGLMLWARDRL